MKELLKVIAGFLGVDSLIGYFLWAFPIWDFVYAYIIIGLLLVIAITQIVWVLLIAFGSRTYKEKKYGKEK